MVCPGCGFILVSSPGERDWLSFSCRQCKLELCYSCGWEKHFPALCIEYHKWRTVRAPFSRRRKRRKLKLGRRVRNCMHFWQTLNELSSAVENYKYAFLLHPNPNLYLIFYRHPDLCDATVQLQSMIDLGRWIKLICSIHPLVERYLDPFKVRFQMSLTDLFDAMPPASMEAETADIRRFRRDAALAQSTLLKALLDARSTPGLQAMALQPRNATLLQFDAIFNEINNPVLPITLFQPLRGELDVTYLALLHQESSLLTSGQ